MKAGYIMGLPDFRVYITRNVHILWKFRIRKLCENGGCSCKLKIFRCGEEFLLLYSYTWRFDFKTSKFNCQKPIPFFDRSLVSWCPIFQNSTEIIVSISKLAGALKSVVLKFSKTFQEKIWDASIIKVFIKYLEILT